MKIIQTLKQPLYLNRIKTFGWNLFYTVALFALALATDIVPTLGLNETVVMVISLAIAQLSKLVHEKNK